MIPSRPPPKLDNPEEFSGELNDFIAKCLVKNADQRPTAKDLLQVLYNTLYIVLYIASYIFMNNRYLFIV